MLFLMINKNNVIEILKRVILILFFVCRLFDEKGMSG